MEKRLIKVRLGKKDYLVPLEHEGFGQSASRILLPHSNNEGFEQRLMRITNHPLDPNKVLVWRGEMRKPAAGIPLQEPPLIENLSNRSIVINEAVLAENRIHEKREIADLIYGTLGKRAWAVDLKVNPEFRRHALGTALRETMLQDMKKRRIREISFPAHKQEGFYLKRGFRKDFRKVKGEMAESFKAKVKELGVKPGLIGSKIRVLWQRSRPRFA